MQNRVMKLWKKFVSIAAAAAVLATSVPVYASHSPSSVQEALEHKTALENIAGLCKILAPEAQAGYPVSNLTDGNPETLWVKDMGGWPCTLEFQLPSSEDRQIQEVALLFESGHTPWGVDVSLSCLTESGEEISVSNADQTIGYDDGYFYSFETPQSMKSLLVTLKNPTNDGTPGQFWPALAEVALYGPKSDEPENPEKLTNIAGECTPTAPSEQSGKPVTNLIDGNPSTLWVNNGGQWPCTVEFRLPPANTKCVKKVNVKLEAGHSEWGMDVNLSYALNNVTSDLISVQDSARTIGFDDGYTYTFEVPQAMTHLYLTLSNPTNAGAPGGFWPAMAEVEIYVDEDAEEVIDLVNIASTLDPQVTVDEDAAETASPQSLVDNDPATSSLLHTGSLQDQEVWAELDFGIDQKMREFVLTLPEAQENFLYDYTLLGKKLDAKAYETITEGVIGTSPDNCTQRITVSHITEQKELEYASVKALFRAHDEASRTSSLSLAEFQVWANSATIAEADRENIAWNKKTLHSNASQDDLAKIVDGNRQNTWTAAQYPAYIDIDLEGLYELSELQVFTPAAGYSQYSLYVSRDGQNFDQVARKTSKESCTGDGESYELDRVQASIVRILLEYHSESEKAVLNEIRILGDRVGDSSRASFTPPVSFADSGYDAELTPQDTIAEVQGIVARNLGEKYKDWFTFSVGAEKEYDYFLLQDASDGKIHITGNDGVSLATGLNHYLKYYCNVSITQVGNQVDMPETIIPVREPVYKECKVPVRYAYNYCTMSYSMPFWGDEEWRKELDWLALNGVNLVLDITGQEEVWRQFLGTLGYDHASIKDFIAGPAYYAWAYMANLSGYGGPVHDSWFTERTELARKNHLIMRKLGMQPVLQGYSGMVPNNIRELAAGEYAVTDSDIILQGTWCSFQRPDMLVTTSEAYRRYARLFYDCQANVYGKDAHYYATDPFHEGGNTGSLNVADVSDYIMQSMLAFDPEAVWVIQAWQGNPKPALMQGLNKEGGTDYRSHALVLDLYAEKTPWWNNSYYPVSEFNQTPWAYCMLNNFGGRMGLHGHMDNLVSGVVEAANTSNCLTGIGITPEGSQNNPVLYDLLFETVWCDDASEDLEEIDTSQWLLDYTRRRYGARSENACEAMLILEDTVYRASRNMLGQGAPESYVNARPSTSINAASTWGNAVISYDMADLEEAAALLLEDYDLLKESDGYLYDLADILKQILSNSSQKYHRAMVTALNSGDPDAFTEASDKFLGLIDEVEKVLGTREEFLLGTWVEQARALAVNADDFSRDLYEFNAKALVTTWGAYPQAVSGGLKDYSNRQWAGLTKDFYRVRWQKWIERQKAVLSGESPAAINWFEFEWEWARSRTEYTTEASGADLEALGWEILEQYNSEDTNPAADDSYDYPVSRLTAVSPNYQDADGNRPADVLDGDSSTLWHTVWGSSERVNHYIVLELSQASELTGLRYLPRSSGTNGIITKYEVYTSMTGEEEDYTLAASGDWANNSEWKLAAFDEAVTAQYVRLVSVESVSSESGKFYSSAAELRLTTPEPAYKPAQSIRISPRSLTLTTGETAQLTAKIRPANADQTVIWSSDNPSVAAVDQDGKVTALAAGTASITAAGAGDTSVTGTAVVTTVPSEEELQIQAEKESLRKLLEEDQVLNETAYTEESWKVYKNALTHAKDILASDQASLQDVRQALTSYQEAREALAKKPAINPPPTQEEETAAARDALQKLLDADRDFLESDYTPESWTAYKKTLDMIRSLLGQPGAEAKQLLAAKAAYETARKQLVKRPAPVETPRVQKITLKAETTRLAAGKTSKIKTSVAPATASRSLTWKSSNPKYASVNAKGVVKAKKAGAGKTVTITASATDGSGVKKSVKIRIYRNPVKKITLKASTKTVKAGKKLRVKAVVAPKKKSYRALQWTSQNTKYATVNAKGVVKTKKAGKGKTVKITARARDGSNRKATIKIRIR